MIPRRLKLTGFLSYQQPVELDFSQFDLACISGSNGAGKSSLLDAITWALFGIARQRDDALINSHSPAAEVVLDFEYEGSLYRIQRTKPRDKTTLLEFFIQDDGKRWKPLTEARLRDTEERIRRTLKLDYETFINASFFLQGRADLFAQQRPADRKRILSNILGLEVWEEYREQAAERRKRLEQDVTNLDALLAEIQTELSQEEPRRERLQALEEQLQQQTSRRMDKEKLLEQARRLSATVHEQRRLVDLLATQANAATLRLEQRQGQLAQYQQERDQYLQQMAQAEEVQAAFKRWQADKKELERWDTLASSFAKVSARRAGPLSTLRVEQVRLEEQRKALLNQQHIVQKQTIVLGELDETLAAQQREVSELQARLDERPALEEERTALLEKRTALKTENERLKNDMTALKERIEQLEGASGVNCPLCGQSLGPQERADLLEELQNQGKEMGDRFRANLEQMRLWDGRAVELEKELFGLEGFSTRLNASHKQVAALENQVGSQRQALQEWQTSGEPQLAELDRRLAINDFANEARVELEVVDAELRKLGYDPDAHEGARQLELNGRAAQEQVHALENARAALAPLEKVLAEQKIQLAAEEKDVAQQVEAHQTALTKYSADAAGLPDADVLESELLFEREQENRLHSEVGGAKQRVEVLKDQKARAKALKTQRGEMTAQIARLKALERAFGKDGVPALLIEQALPEIEDQANEILNRLTEGDMSVRFSTQKDYRDKNRDDKKETLEILISDGAGTREYEMFSGGEGFRINFAIRLALSRVLAQRAGARLQTLVIDEGFGSQDAEGRSRLIEAINLVRPDFACVLVITHLEELKDAFPVRIEVEKTLTGSTLRVVV